MRPVGSLVNEETGFGAACDVVAKRTKTAQKKRRDEALMVGIRELVMGNFDARKGPVIFVRRL